MPMVSILSKERAMAAKQILDVVFRRRDQHVEAGLVLQPVEKSGIERRCAVSRDVEHVQSPLRHDFAGSLANPPWKMNRCLAVRQRTLPPTGRWCDMAKRTHAPHM